MALKNLLDAIKREGYVVPALDLYLEKISGESEGRAMDVNAPSFAGNCLRAGYYSRKGFLKDGNINARVQRIFDNGTHVHLRLQKYLSDMSLLIVDEVPLINDEYRIQGHTDGFLDLGDEEVGILEIKSMKDSQFSPLKAPKRNHVLQGMVYAFCAEERRKLLHIPRLYPTLDDFYASEGKRAEYFENHYQHLTGGRKFDRASKIKHEVEMCLVCDDILYRTDRPVTKSIFLYENKDTQELKEFVVSMDDKGNMDSLNEELKRYRKLNRYCDNEELPPREGSKSSDTCRWCDYKTQCWVV